MTALALRPTAYKLHFHDSFLSATICQHLCFPRQDGRQHNNWSLWGKLTGKKQLVAAGEMMRNVYCSSKHMHTSLLCFTYEIMFCEKRRMNEQILNPPCNKICGLLHKPLLLVTNNQLPFFSFKWIFMRSRWKLDPLVLWSNLRHYSTQKNNHFYKTSI